MRDNEYTTQLMLKTNKHHYIISYYVSSNYSRNEIRIGAWSSTMYAGIIYNDDKTMIHYDDLVRWMEDCIFKYKEIEKNSYKV